MTDTSTLIARNAARWAAAKLTRGPEFAAVAKRLVASKARYQVVANSTGVPWFVIAVIHERESSQNWRSNLGQGDPWNKVSTHVPAGRGPFSSWEAAAEDALRVCSPYAAKWKDWSIGGTLTLLEMYNGLAYSRAGRPSPHVWSGTDIYDPPTGPSGKIVVDHGPIEPITDKQLGCAGLIIAMKALDPSIAFAGQPVAVPPPAPSAPPPMPPPLAPPPAAPGPASAGSGLGGLLVMLFKALFKPKG